MAIESVLMKVGEVESFTAAQLAGSLVRGGMPPSLDDISSGGECELILVSLFFLPLVFVVLHVLIGCCNLCLWGTKGWSGTVVINWLVEKIGKRKCVCEFCCSWLKLCYICVNYCVQYIFDHHNDHYTIRTRCK
ncbi:hypothetical protein ACP275_12G136000 [Erythranthe tilingii]